MRKSTPNRDRLLFSVAAGALSLSLAGARPARDGRLALIGATVWDGTGAPAIADATVLIEKGRIQAVGPRAKVKVPAGAQVTRVDGKYILPGLVDAHVHFFQSGGLYTRPDAVDLTAVKPYASEAQAVRADLDDTFLRYLVNGVTAVVDCGGPLWNFAVRARAETVPLAPRVAATGPLISTVARPQLAYGDPPDLPILRADNPDAARAMVKAQLPHQPSFIKIWLVQTPDRPLAESLAIVNAVIAEAHAAGVRVAVHATELSTALAALKAGADVLVHSVQDLPVDDDFVRLLKERKVPLVPTLVVLDGYRRTLGSPAGKAPSHQEQRYGAPSALASWAEWPKVATDAARAAGEQRRARLDAAVGVAAKNLKTLAAAGAIIAAGTDAGNIGTLPGASMHEELWAMARAGMSNRDVLLAATRDAARVFAEKPEFGTLIAGMRADLLVLGGDPLADLGNLEQIELVMQDGVGHAPDEILAPNPAWVVDRQIDAYNAADLERFLSFYPPDARIVDFPAGDKTMTGAAELRERYGKLFKSSPHLHCIVLAREIEGNHVIDHELVTGINGRPYLHAIVIYEVTRGKIPRVWFVK